METDFTSVVFVKMYPGRPDEEIEELIFLCVSLGLRVTTFMGVGLVYVE